MRSPMQWNDPKQTWRLASYQAQPERRKAAPDRREDPRRSALGDRRRASRRSLASLLRL